VNVVEVATPLALVVAIVVFVPFAKVPLAPEAGAVNVTVTPLTGIPSGDPLFVTVATSGANAVLTAALCGVPLVAAIDSTGGAELEPLPQPIRKLNVRKINPRMLA
jgi:hypothetical protein